MALGSPWSTAGCDFDAGVDCVLGEEKSCTSRKGCKGVRHCQSGVWGDCECESTTLGSACKRNSDCGKSETCLTETSELLLGGGIPGGVCARECSDDYAVCEKDEEPTVCVVTTGTSKEQRAFCLPSCELGDGDVDKCMSRHDVACDQGIEGTTEAFCRPLCVSDGDCREGGRCNPATGACTKGTTGGGLQFGEQCDADALEPLCQGTCLSVGESESGNVAYCSHGCVLAPTKGRSRPYTPTGTGVTWRASSDSIPARPSSSDIR